MFVCVEFMLLRLPNKLYAYSVTSNSPKPYTHLWILHLKSFPSLVLAALFFRRCAAQMSPCALCHHHDGAFAGACLFNNIKPSARCVYIPFRVHTKWYSCAQCHTPRSQHAAKHNSTRAFTFAHRRALELYIRGASRGIVGCGARDVLNRMNAAYNRGFWCTVCVCVYSGVWWNISPNLPHESRDHHEWVFWVGIALGMFVGLNSNAN